MKRDVYKLLAEKYVVINETVADEFDSILQNAGFPKKDYDTAEVMNLIGSYLKKFDPQDINYMVYQQIRMALQWNEIDPGILSDYVQDKAGASGPHLQDPQTGDENMVSEASGEQALQSVTNFIDDRPINSIEIQTHYGNIVLPIVEVWVQDEVLKISVDHSKLEGQ